MVRATVITDASFCHETKAGGWAAWIALDGGDKRRHHGTFKDTPASAEHAELWAALNGVWLAASAGANDILVQTDCLNVVRNINEPLRRAAARWAVKRHLDVAVAPIRERGAIPTVRAKHVKGHATTGDARTWVNRWCDMHARRHMRREREVLRKNAGARWLAKRKRR